MLTNIATLEFAELESNDTGVFIVDAGPGQVGVCVSLAHNGDTHAVVTAADARRLLQALEEAIARAQQL